MTGDANDAPPRSKLELKDWVSLGSLAISTVALLVAIGGAYFNFFRTADDVRAVIGRTPLATINPHTHKLEVHSTLDVTDQLGH
jgi:hypothetical protein